MKAAAVTKIASMAQNDEILTSGEGKKVITLSARTKRSASRFSLDPQFEEKPLYKAEIIIDRFLNEK